MFEIRCLVGDKKLIQVLTVLDGHTLEPPVVVPVKGTAAVNGHTHAEPANPRKWTTVPGGSVNLMRQFIKGHKMITAKQMREHCEASGYTKNGYSYSLQKLLEEGALKKAKEFGVYEVIR